MTVSIAFSGDLRRRLCSSPPAPTPIASVLAGSSRSRSASPIPTLWHSLRTCSLPQRLWRWDASQARRSHPRIQRSYALYPAGACDRLRLHLTLHQDDSQSLSGWTVNTWSRFARQRGERLRPLLAYPALATIPSPAAASAATLATAPLSRVARARTPASRARTLLAKDATRPRLAAALLHPDSSQTLQRLLPSSPSSNLKATAEAEPSGKMCPPRASTETGEDCSTSSRLYIFPRPPLPC